jgi:hypothetical protein
MENSIENPSTHNQKKNIIMSRKRPVTASSVVSRNKTGNILISDQGVSKPTKKEDQALYKEKVAAGGGATRPKEIGKVKPMQIIKPDDNECNYDEDDKNGEGNGKEIGEEEEDNLSLIEEKSMPAPVAVGVPVTFDPTKDFYSTTGRPVTPIIGVGAKDVEDDGTKGTYLEKNTGPADHDGSVNLRSKSHHASSTPSGGSERVKVIVRSRPMSQKELLDGHEWYVCEDAFYEFGKVYFCTLCESRKGHKISLCYLFVCVLKPQYCTRSSGSERH